MVSVDPADGETNVPVSVTVQAELSLLGSQIDLTSLSNVTASLTDAAGTEVAATRRMMGNTVIVDPETDLEPGSTYAFVVSSGLRTENGTPVAGAESTFTTAREGVGPGDGLVTDRERVVFSAGGASSQDTRTLTLINANSETLNVSSVIEGDAASQFSSADSTFSLAPGEARELELTFSPAGLGPQLATLVLTGDDGSSVSVDLGWSGDRRSGRRTSSPRSSGF